MTSDAPVTHTPVNDGLADCLLYVSERLGKPLTRADLSEAEVGLKSTYSVSDAVNAAKLAGFVPWFGEVRIKDLDASLLPLIAVLNNDRMVVVTAVDRKEGVTYWDPRIPQEETQATPAEFTELFEGHVLIMRRRPTDLPEKENSARGHWFWSAFFQNGWSVTQILIAAAVTNMLGLATSIFIMVVYDRVLPNEAIESLVALTAGMAIALFFDFIIKTLRAGFIDRLGHRTDREIGRRIFEQLLNLPLKSRTGSTGALASTLREFETVREFFSSATLILFVDLPFIVLFIFVIYMVGGPLALIPAVSLPLVLIVGIATQPRLSRLAKENMEMGQTKQSVLVETVAGLETVKSAGAARILRERWDKALNAHSTYGLKSRAVSQFAMNSTAFVQQSAQILIVFYGVFLIRDGAVTMGALIASVILTGRALGPLGQLAQALTRLNQVRSSYQTLNKLMQAESERPPGRRFLERSDIKGSVEFDGVSFSYPEASVAALRDCSFTIKPGERVAVLGRIGSGKSTVARMLQGLYHPDEGAVRIDGADVRQIDPVDLRRSVAAVLQDSFLFSGTIRQNIAMGAERPYDADILRAAKISGVDDFVKTHPDGYDMKLAERGEGLSGGQRQAITIARALVGRPKVLVLDEPTSAMDLKSEETFKARLSEALTDETVIIITHRPSLLDLADRVIVIEGGRLVADGPKSEIQRRSKTAKAAS